MSKSAKTPMSRASKKKLYITIGVIVIVALVAVSYFTSPAFLRTKTVGTAAGDKITEAEYAYHYQAAYQDIYDSVYNTYGEYTYMFLDTTKPLDEQQCAFKEEGKPEDYTWHDYISEAATARIEQIHAIKAASEAAGYALPETETAIVEANVNSMKSSAEELGYSSALYLRAVYGHGMNEKLYRAIVTDLMTADAYSGVMQASFTYTDDELNAYYEANKMEFDTVDLRMISISGEANEDGTEIDLTQAEETAKEALATYTDEESLAEFGVNLDEEDAIEEAEDTLYTYVPHTELTPEGMAEWFFDEAREYGDMEIFHDNNAYYVAFFIDRHDIDYNVVNMRHILVTPTEKDENNVFTVESTEAAAELCDEYLKEWEASDMTEETFAAMAAKYTTDEGSKATGGLYADIYKGQMTRVVNDWLFDEARAEGDYTIVQSSFGFHLVLFCGEGDNYKTTTITDAMLTEDYTEWYDGVYESLEMNIDENAGSVMLG